MGADSSHWEAGQPERMLGALRFAWGDAYLITGSGDQWRAERLDGLGEVIEATTPEELGRAIRDDYLTRPVRK